MPSAEDQTRVGFMQGKKANTLHAIAPGFSPGLLSTNLHKETFC